METESGVRTARPVQGFRVARDEDRAGEHHSLSIGILSFKVSSADSHGTLLALELVGPPLDIEPRS